MGRTGELLLGLIALSTLTEGFFYNNEVSPFQDANCQCTCNCKDAPDNNCDLDLYVVLDAAVCVKDIWQELKFRVNLLAKNIDENYGLGGESTSSNTRISIISYAKQANINIRIEDGLNYYQFSEALDKIDWVNEGSYLNNGLSALEKYMREGHSDNRSKAVLLVTNGKSHKTVGDLEVSSILKRISNEMNAKIFVNTLVPIKNEMAYSDCKVCDFNRVLFSNQLELEIRNEDNKLLEFTRGSVISKDDLTKLFNIEMNFMCPESVDPKYCDDCSCKCVMPEGPPGIDGRFGGPGNAGLSGKQGQDGLPGLNGRCGIKGPNGVEGLMGKPGSPGSHGKYGFEGLCGEPGLIGINGINGRPGRPGASGSMGYRGFPGEPGFQGNDGKEGSRGKNGNKGPIGEPGYPGPTGPMGVEGQPGEPGLAGEDGSPGDEGLRGERGDTGLQGDIGEPGDKGSDGNPGPVGIEGDQGSRGVNGLDGPKGMVGVKGNPGRVGRSGKLSKGIFGVNTKVVWGYQRRDVTGRDGPRRITN